MYIKAIEENIIKSFSSFDGYVNIIIGNAFIVPETDVSYTNINGSIYAGYFPGEKEVCYLPSIRRPLSSYGLDLSLCKTYFLTPKFTFCLLF